MEGMVGAAGAAGAWLGGSRLPWSSGADGARWLRLFLHLRSALLAYQPTLTLALEIETHLKGNSSFWSLKAG